ALEANRSMLLKPLTQKEWLGSETSLSSDFRAREIDEEYERDCEIRIRKLKQDFNIWGSEVRKKEKAYEDEKYAAACRYMLSVTCDDEDDYIPLAITTDLPIEESENSLKMGDEPLNTIPATESDEIIKSSVENHCPNPSSLRGDFDIDPILEEFAGELAHIAPIPPGIVEADFDPNDDDDNLGFYAVHPNTIHTPVSQNVEPKDSYNG
ncbi:hypothetical protein Tco_0962902, partial [Tanacetum coccineum]